MTYHITKPKPAPVSPRILPANEPPRPMMTLAEYAAIENARRLQRDGMAPPPSNPVDHGERYGELIQRLNDYMRVHRKAKARQIREHLQLSKNFFANFIRYSKASPDANFAYQTAGQVYVWRGEQ